MFLEKKNIYLIDLPSFSKIIQLYHELKWKKHSKRNFQFVIYICHGYITWLSGARQTLRLYALWNAYQLTPDKPIGQAKKEIWPGSFVLIFLCLSTYKIEILSMWTTMYTKVFASWPLKMCIVCILAHSESLFLNFNNKVG